MSEADETLITIEMRASIGREESPVVYEVERLGIRQFARAVGYSDPLFFDEAYARRKGYRSLPAPPGYLGSPIYRPDAPLRSPGDPDPAAGGRRWRVLNGGNEYDYTGEAICAGDVLTAVTRTVEIRQRQGSLGAMLIETRETVYTNQNGQIVCRASGNLIRY